MADDKMTFSTLTTKQKVIGVLLVVILGFIIYEVMGLFSSGEKNTAQMAHPMLRPASSPKPTQMTMGPAGTLSVPPGAPVQSAVATVSTVTLPESSDLQKQQAAQQQMYLDSVNQLQLLKIKREIAETNQAIASARLATETANKSMSDLLTQPSLP